MIVSVVVVGRAAAVEATIVIAVFLVTSELSLVRRARLLATDAFLIDLVRKTPWWL